MTYKLSIYLTEKLIDKELIDTSKIDIYRTGFELIISDIITSFLIFTAGIVMNEFIYSCIYALIMLIVRKFSGGYHAKTYWLCRTVTVGTFILIVITSRVNAFNIFVCLAFNIIAVVTMIIFAPIRHPNKQLTENEYKANKVFSVITTLFFSVISIALFFVERKEGLVISLTLLAITALMYVGLLTNREEGVKIGKAD